MRWLLIMRVRMTNKLLFYCTANSMGVDDYSELQNQQTNIEQTRKNRTNKEKKTKSSKVEKQSRMRIIFVVVAIFVPDSDGKKKTFCVHTGLLLLLLCQIYACFWRFCLQICLLLSLRIDAILFLINTNAERSQFACVYFLFSSSLLNTQPNKLKQ